MDDLTEASDPHAAIAMLEARIEELTGRIEGCRKYALAARGAIALGALLLGATLFGLTAFDARLFLAGIAALLGGLVLAGSNTTTARQAAEERDRAEAQRAALIGNLSLRVIPGGRTLH
jgi:hypothetical protein